MKKLHKSLVSTNERVARIQAVIAGAAAIIGGALAIAEALTPNSNEKNS